MDQHGLTRADMVPVLGTNSRVGEVLGGQRELSLSRVLRLRERFNISADLLISKSQSKRASKRMAGWFLLDDETQQKVLACDAATTCANVRKLPPAANAFSGEASVE
jgi:hypothetical protein